MIVLFLIQEEMTDGMGIDMAQMMAGAGGD